MKYYIWKKTDRDYNKIMYMVVRKGFLQPAQGLDDDKRWKEIDWAVKYPFVFPTVEDAQKFVQKMKVGRKNGWEEVTQQEMTLNNLKK